MSGDPTQQWMEWWKGVSGKDPLPELDQKFIEFHVAHPSVYTDLVQLARSAKAKGHSKFGLRMLWEVTRWRSMMAGDEEAQSVKLNDRFISLYARLIMAAEPELQDMFEVRKKKS